MGIIAESEYRFVIPGHGRMRVPGVVFATRALIPDPAGDRALEQVVNVAELPGIVAASDAMPDVHWGYGFPIGGVAATDVARGGAVSPGGVGFDICSGVRLLVASISGGELVPVLGQVMDRIAAAVPCGAGRGGLWDLHGRAELDKLLAGGAAYAVEEVFDPAAAQVFGLAEGQVCVMIHCGSRGLGHQVCSDHVQIMDQAMARHAITVPDRQLACAPASSPEGRGYLGAMAAAANYARANRPLLTQAAAACSPAPPTRRWTWSMTCPTTWPRWKPTRSAGSPSGCASTAREQPGRCRPGIPTAPPRCQGGATSAGES